MFCFSAPALAFLPMKPFQQVGLTPTPGASTSMMPQGRTAVFPEPRTEEAAVAYLRTHGATVQPITPCGIEVKGLDIAAVEGTLAPEVAGALEVLMAARGFVLLRKQGRPLNEAGIRGTYLSAKQQCKLSECFGAGALHSTHGVHPEAPMRDIFRLSNHQEHGFNSVGPEWHNDGSFCREVFGYVVYHIIKAPEGEGDTRFAHLGAAYDLLTPAVQERLKKCASINSNSGAVHPLASPHPVSGRTSLYLHLGMTGAMLENPSADAPSCEATAGVAGVTLRESEDVKGVGEDVKGVGAGAAPGAAAASAGFGFGDGSTPAGLPTATPAGAEAHGIAPGVVAWRDAEMEAFFSAFSSLLDNPAVSHSHKWEEGDVVIIDNLAVAHKATPGAHTKAAGLRILHRTTVLSSRAFDPPPHLGMPHTLDTGEHTGVFGAGATWAEGYVGFRWGDWGDRGTPH